MPASPESTSAAGPLLDLGEERLDRAELLLAPDDAAAAMAHGHCDCDEPDYEPASRVSRESSTTPASASTRSRSPVLIRFVA